jgi:hypothetical protein
MLARIALMIILMIVLAIGVRIGAANAAISEVECRSTEALVEYLDARGMIQIWTGIGVKNTKRVLYQNFKKEWIQVIYSPDGLKGCTAGMGSAAKLDGVAI